MSKTKNVPLGSRVPSIGVPAGETIAPVDETKVPIDETNPAARETFGGFSASFGHDEEPPPAELSGDKVGFKLPSAANFIMNEPMPGRPLILVPLFDGPVAGYVSRHFELQMTPRQADALARLRSGLAIENVRTSHGKCVAEHASRVIAWLLDHVADAYDQLDAAK